MIIGQGSAMVVRMTSGEAQRNGFRMPGIQNPNARNRTLQVLESLNPIRLFCDTSGQVLLFGAVLVLAILAFLLAMPNATRVTTQKVRAQTSADVGAFSGSIWLARSLNLTANLNVGIRSVYTWMTVLTVGEALAQALYTDTLDSTVHALGGNITQALFGSSNPVTVHGNEYAGSIRKLDTTALWLYELQDDIATSFTQVAALMGSDEASRNMGGNSLSQTAGGSALAHTNDSLPLLDTSYVGDSLLYAVLGRLPAALDTIPTLDPNITPATGLVIINPNTWNVWAYYSDTSLWMNRVDTLKHLYKKPIIQSFRNKNTGAIDTIIEYFDKPGGGSYTAYLHGDSWAHWVWKCGETGGHTPVIWPNGFPNAPYKNTAVWTLLDAHPGNNRYKVDTVWTHRHMAKRLDTAGMRNYIPTAESLYMEQHGDDRTSYYWIPTGFYTGAESTVPIRGARVRPRRVNPNREFHTVSYVWHQGAASSPYGLGPPLGGGLFPRSAVAPASPLFAVARAVPFLPVTITDYFFEPGWDARLTALDSVAVADITSDTAFASHTQGSFDNLEDLRKYVLLP
jgi:hypothetical protein